jgi:hypothetical protein
MRKYVFMVILITALIVFSFSTLSASNTDKVNIGFNISEENQKREVISSDGNLRWNKTFGGSNDDYLRSLIQTDDGGYVITGETSSYSTGKADIWIIKIDSKGNKLWDKTFGGIDDDSAYLLIQTDDGGYAAAGYTFSFGAGKADFWLIKLDSRGNKLWDRTFGGINDDSLRSLVQTDDGGYVLAGITFSFGAGEGDFWIIKLDEKGNLESAPEK